MAYNIRVHNPGPYEVVMDMRGRILAGHSSTDADSADAYTARLLKKGVLLNLGKLDSLEASSVEDSPKAARTSTKTTTKSTADAGAETGEK